MVLQTCGIGGCSHHADASVARGARRLALCASHFVRWSAASAELAAERNEVEASRLAKLAARACGSKIAGRRPKPGTAAAIATLGRGGDKRRVARRRP